jgi:hypothetical protein
LINNRLALNFSITPGLGGIGPDASHMVVPGQLGDPGLLGGDRGRLVSRRPIDITSLLKQTEGTRRGSNLSGEMPGRTIRSIFHLDVDARRFVG